MSLYNLKYKLSVQFNEQLKNQNTEIVKVKKIKEELSKKNHKNSKTQMEKFSVCVLLSKIMLTQLIQPFYYI